jgi:hypothetical protein
MEEKYMKKFYLEIVCSHDREAADIMSLIARYRSGCDLLWQEELGHTCPLTDGEIVKECMIDGLRTVRKAITLVRQHRGSKK